MRTLEEYKELIQEIEKEYLQQPLITLDGSRLWYGESINDRIDWLINIGVNIYDTINEQLEEVCPRMRYRSLGDLYLLYIQNYSPLYGYTSLFSFIRSLVELLDEGKVRTLFCSDIRKRIFYEAKTLRSYWNAWTGGHEVDFNSTENGLTIIDYKELSKLFKEEDEKIQNQGEISSRQSQYFEREVASSGV